MKFVASFAPTDRPDRKEHDDLVAEICEIIRTNWPRDDFGKNFVAFIYREESPEGEKHISLDLREVKDENQHVALDLQGELVNSWTFPVDKKIPAAAFIAGWLSAYVEDHLIEEQLR